MEASERIALLEERLLRLEKRFSRDFLLRNAANSQAFLTEHSTKLKCILYRDSMICPPVGGTTVSFNVVVLDNGPLFDPSVPTRITIPEGGGGTYMFRHRAFFRTGPWTGAGGYYRQCQVAVRNSAGVSKSLSTSPGPVVISGFQPVDTLGFDIVDLEPGDYLTVIISQDSGVNLSVYVEFQLVQLF